MYRSLALNGLRLIAFSSVLFCLQAFAQFEVSPDHFDSPRSQNTVRKTERKKETQTKRTPAAHLVQSAPAIAGASTPRDRQNRGQSASRMAQRRQSQPTLQQGVKQSQMAAVHRKRSNQKQTAAVSP